MVESDQEQQTLTMEDNPVYTQLLDSFFSENSINTDMPTAPTILHFLVKMESNINTSLIVQETLNEIVLNSYPERKTEALSEKTEIESVSTYEKVIWFLRRGTDTVNQKTLLNKALEFEHDVVPDIVKRLKTSLNDGFIEMAIRVLARSELKVVDEIFGYYHEMPYPYAQSLVLVLFGFKADETHIPWIIEQYHTLKKLYPDKSYSDGAFYALLEMDSRFNVAVHGGVGVE